MSMHKSGRNDNENPGASVKTLGEYIQQMEKQQRKEFEANLTEYERGYQDGWHDAHVKIKAGE